MNRRQFLKYSAAGAIASFVPAMFSPVMSRVTSSGRNVSFTSKEFREGIPSICDLCPARCGVLGFREGNYLAGIQGNPKHPGNQGKICARGVAAMNLVYHPKRILHPLMRDGDVESGKWKHISWDEAIGHISKRLQENDGTSTFLTDDSIIDTWLMEELQRFPNLQVVLDEHFYNRTKLSALLETWGPVDEWYDITNTRYLLNLGANPLESDLNFIQFSQRLTESKVVNGLKIVTVDPRLSNTATRSDLWIPIKPGTDSVVILAIANLIMNSNAFDSEFIEKWANVESAALRYHLRKYTPEYAEKYSTIPAETIRQIADELQTHKPALVIAGSNVVSNENGFENERSVLLLNALIGSIDTKGGMCRIRQNRSIANTNITNYPTFSQYSKSKIDQPESNETIFLFKTNPKYQYPSSNFSSNLSDKSNNKKFIISIQSIFDETTIFADIVLPTTVFLEEWHATNHPQVDETPYFAVGKPVTEPRGEARAAAQIMQDIRSVIAPHSGARYIDGESYANNKIIQFVSSRNHKVLWETGVIESESYKYPYKTYEEQGFGTESRRFQLLSNTKTLPDYVPDNSLHQLKKNEFIVVPFSLNIMDERLGDCKWLAEIKHKNACLINAKVGRQLRLKNGDAIKVTQNKTSIVAEVRLTETVHPSIIAVSRGFGHMLVEDNQIPGEKQIDPDTKLIWWQHESYSVNVNTLLDPTNLNKYGSLMTNNTVVTVQPIS
ncbi:molybdopterin-dependent oxidoreductase [candidate division KSB1 bacterium]|nr:molybdopterin-dependent oxidoreductase [candidate division KSB1 bacterium]